MPSSKWYSQFSLSARRHRSLSDALRALSSSTRPTRFVNRVVVVLREIRTVIHGNRATIHRMRDNHRYSRAPISRVVSSRVRLAGSGSFSAAVSPPRRFARIQSLLRWRIRVQSRGLSSLDDEIAASGARRRVVTGRRDSLRFIRDCSRGP